MENVKNGKIVIKIVVEFYDVKTLISTLKIPTTDYY